MQGDTGSCVQDARPELLGSGELVKWAVFLSSWELDSPLVLGGYIRLGGSVFDFVIYTQSGFFLEASSHYQ